MGLHAQTERTNNAAHDQKGHESRRPIAVNLNNGEFLNIGHGLNVWTMVDPSEHPNLWGLIRWC